MVNGLILLVTYTSLRNTVELLLKVLLTDSVMEKEDPKGHVRATRKTDGTHDIVFIENKKAKKYINIVSLFTN